MGDMVDKIGRLIRDPGVQVDVTGFVFALIVSSIVGLLVAALYEGFYENRGTGSQVHRSFLLMSPSITALFIAIQFSLPLSLGLLGALSIIRFRTPIKEPEEVGFIMLLIAASVVCATFQFLLLLVLLSVALILLLTRRWLPGLSSFGGADGVLLLSVDGVVSDETNGDLLSLLQKQLDRGCRIQSVSCDDRGTTLSYSFRRLDAHAVGALEQSLRTIVPMHKLNIFYQSHAPLA